ncbi:FtsX-like permease family protein [Streptococcus orisratti]|uniref:FtsX-like permease family protein n=1 Tax=Streptococcus orisratti TaxID=114652 RepID=UPI00036A67AB|nr:ABC transporter permease [Streptococcus orisratti]
MFYFKLAYQNIRKSLSIFAPFVLASTVLYTLLSSLFLIILSPVKNTMGSGIVALVLGVVVMTIFSLIMEIYSFNFLMKQRAREFGLYNILGMTKKRVSLIASIELWMIFIIIICLGSILSGAFSNLLYLIFINLIQVNQFNFVVIPMAFVLTAVIFAGIFAVLEIIAVRTIGKVTPLLLFRSSEKGEQEPKGNLLLAVLSLLSLGLGYYLSLSSGNKSGLAVIYLFFLAVLPVILGTYLFYVSFIAWYLKRRRRNKVYFYQPEHFITTSQMLFRMKQHAVGLANITLLAVMAFVTVATTVSLHTGTISSVDKQFPKKSSIIYKVANRSQGEEAFQLSVLKKYPAKADAAIRYLTATLALPYDGGQALALNPTNQTNPVKGKFYYTILVTQDDFRKLGNELAQLKDNQITFITPEVSNELRQLTIGNETYQAIKGPEKLFLPDLYATFNPALLVVANDNVLEMVMEKFSQVDEVMGVETKMEYHVFTDLSNKQVQHITSKGGGFTDKNINGYIVQKSDTLAMMLSFTGGFLFTGFMLGISFLLGAALIIYYKQYSEGHEDRKSYKILQEVGMSKQFVQRTINSQIILVFFLPLLMASLHFAVSLVLLKRMLAVFGVTSSSLIYSVSVITILLICAIYYLIYKLTSRIYYRIIER